MRVSRTFEAVVPAYGADGDYGSHESVEAALERCKAVIPEVHVWRVFRVTIGTWRLERSVRVMIRPEATITFS